MLPKLDSLTIVTSWTNGRTAIVHLLENANGEKMIMKMYRRGFTGTMLREYFVATYVAARLPTTAKVLGFRPSHRELLFSYVRGERTLEWVLHRFGEKGLLLSKFQSFHGLDTNVQVTRAFSRFRDSKSEGASSLKQAI